MEGFPGPGKQTISDIFLVCLYEVKGCLCFTPGMHIRVSARGLLGSDFAFRSIS